MQCLNIKKGETETQLYIYGMQVGSTIASVEGLFFLSMGHKFWFSP